MSHILFCGLGNMGAPMAQHLLSSGERVTVFNRTIDKSIKFSETYDCEYIEQLTSSMLADLDQPITHIVLCVGNDNDVRHCLTNDPTLLENCADNVLIIDHSTTSAALAEEMAQYANSKTARFVDAPVSGGEQGAINGQLTIMVGADTTDYQAVKSLCRPYTKTITYMGGVGTGQTAKMVNQVCVAGVLAGLAEGICLARDSQLDVDLVIETLSGGAAGSWQMQNRGKTMHRQQFDFGFAIRHMLKDLNICLDHSQTLNLDMPITHAVKDQYQQLLKQGHGDLDTSALFLSVINANRSSSESR